MIAPAHSDDIPTETEASRAAGTPIDDAVEAERVNGLVLAYRTGRTELLAELFVALRPILRTALKRCLTSGRSLPDSLERADLDQQSWLILDTLARRWSPTGGDFGAYVRVVFPWELWRFIRANSPGHRARTTRVDNVDHAKLLEQLGERPGVDGRDWDERLIADELLDELDPLARHVLRLHLLEDRSFPEVARAVQISSTGAAREYQLAMDRLRLRVDLDMKSDDATDRRRELERFVVVLHQAAFPNGRLPGRNEMCAWLDISEERFTRLMSVLVERGCVIRRSARHAGRLAHATPAETLACATDPSAEPRDQQSEVEAW